MIHQKSKRRVVREKVLQILYACELNQDFSLELSEDLLDELTDKTDREFATNLVLKVQNNLSELNGRIKEKVANWEMNRIALIDKILLQMGIAEILYFPDIPPKVSINESIEIAKDYSTAGSGKFLNGILDAILAEERKKGKLNKSGRGLVEESMSKSSN
jgi:N utilization substance protein B